MKPSPRGLVFRGIKILRCLKRAGSSRPTTLFARSSAMKILALDCGKNKSVFLDYQGGNGPREYGKVNTRPQEIHDLLVSRQPEVFVLESGPDAGWICDIAG